MAKNYVTLIIYLALILAIKNQTIESLKNATPQNLDLSPLRNLNLLNSPMSQQYSYRNAIKRLDFRQLKSDMQKLLTNSQDFWPADYGNYGPFFIRLSWHAAGTYRVFDGRGGGNRGQQRFTPLDSWPDNVNLDKARLLLWPIKQKYGDKLSWSDLLVLAGTIAIDSMGLKTIGFAFGREDDWLGDGTIWGTNPTQLSSNVNNGDLKKPFSATQMGLIYVNPEGPNGVPDRAKSVNDIRAAFSGMGMDDRETVVLIAGGHTFGKTHGAAPSNKHVAQAPNKAPINLQGLGWHNSFGTGKGPDTITSGLQGIWTSTPTKWSHDFFYNLYDLQWKKSLSPGQANQWNPTNATKNYYVPDAFVPNKYHLPTMLTTDLALKEDQSYNKYAIQFYKNPKQFAKSFAEAWFKLTHRDMGPKSRYLGPWLPNQDFIWQDPVPAVDHKLVSEQDVVKLKMDILNSGLTIPQLVKTAWASASTYRKTDYRGGSNGARIALLPARNWPKNEPQQLQVVLEKLRGIQRKFNLGKMDGTRISLADLIVLAGNTAVQKAALKSGFIVQIPLVPGRTDATQQQTDIQSYNYLNTKSDGFINYAQPQQDPQLLPQALIQKAGMLTLSIPQMSVLVAGLRVLGANHGGSQKGVFTSSVGVLDNSFFVNLLDNDIVWDESNNSNQYIGVSRSKGKGRWLASTVDLIFGFNQQLRAVAQKYAQSGNNQKFVIDFAHSWQKVMMLGRFDVEV